MAHYRIPKAAAFASLFLFPVLTALAEEQLPQFVEASEEAGLIFDHATGATGRCYPPEINSAGLVVFDYDNDGWMDVYAVNGNRIRGPVDSSATNSLFRNAGNGRFDDVTVEAGVADVGYGMGGVAGDVDGDGDLDLYVVNYGPNVLYRNEGDGTFSDVSAAAGLDDVGWGGGAAFTDYDGDGDLDLYLANYVVYEPGDERPEFAAYLGRIVPGNRVDDLYPSPVNFPAAQDRLFRNDGKGEFTDVSESAGITGPESRSMGVLFCDYDLDGDPDLFVANDLGPNLLYRNDGPWPDGRFTEVGLRSGIAYDGDLNSQATMGVAAGDLDGDGLEELVTTAFQEEPFALYRNDGDGLFHDAAFASNTARYTIPILGWGVVTLDYDNDGDLDLFIAAGHVQDGIERVDPGATTAQRNLLLRNDGHGRFEDVGDRAGAGLSLIRQSRGSARIDFDNDGDEDLVVLDRHCRLPHGVEDGLGLLRNDGGDRAGWLTIILSGRRNRQAIGARVELWSGEKIQVREIHAGSGYQSQND